jgi:hypothetical protein
VVWHVSHVLWLHPPTRHGGIQPILGLSFPHGCLAPLPPPPPQWVPMHETRRDLRYNKPWETVEVDREGCIFWKMFLAPSLSSGGWEEGGGHRPIPFGGTNGHGKREKKIEKSVKENGIKN